MRHRLQSLLNLSRSVASLPTAAPNPTSVVARECFVNVAQRKRMAPGQDFFARARLITGLFVSTVGFLISCLAIATAGSTRAQARLRLALSGNSFEFVRREWTLSRSSFIGSRLSVPACSTTAFILDKSAATINFGACPSDGIDVRALTAVVIASSRYLKASHEMIVPPSSAQFFDLFPGLRATRCQPVHSL